MPFKSKAQARAAFGGYLGPEMKAKAEQRADETPGGVKNLPVKVKQYPGLGHTRFHLRATRQDTLPRKGGR